MAFGGLGSAVKGLLGLRRPKRPFEGLDVEEINNSVRREELMDRERERRRLKRGQHWGTGYRMSRPIE